MVHMTNTNGMILPVKEVSALAHSKGIMVCVDAAQSVGHIKTDVKELGCDFMPPAVINGCGALKEQASCMQPGTSNTC